MELISYTYPLLLDTRLATFYFIICDIMQIPLTEERLKRRLYVLMGQDSSMFRSICAGAMGEADRLRSPHLIARSLSQSAPIKDPDLAGVILNGINKEHMARLTTLRIPIINTSYSQGVLPGLGNFLSDDLAVGRLAATHLLQRGYESFLAVHLPNRNTHAERAEGFRIALHEKGFSTAIHALQFPLIGSGFRGYLGYLEGIGEQLRPCIQNLPLGSAIFCSNDETAMQLRETLHKDFPEHLLTCGLLGVDNMAQDMVRAGDFPPLSSVIPGFHQIGAEAMRWMLTESGPDAPERCAHLLRRFPPAGLAARASTLVGGCADPLTARVVRWIWEAVQRGEKISVADAARTHHLTRKTLERRFSHYLKRSPGDFIQSMRLDLARELLRNSALGIAEISVRCGFAKQDVLSRAIRAKTGLTPSQFRKQSL